MEHVEYSHYIPSDVIDGGEEARIAQVGEIKFSAMKYQPYYCRVGKYAARVNEILSSERPNCWRAALYICHPDGTQTFHKDNKLYNEDEIFIWAATQLTQLLELLD